MQAIEAIKRWRATTTDGTFLTWLAREQKAGRIDAAEFSVIKEGVEGGTENTEALAYVVSFIAEYHELDLASMPLSGDAVDSRLFGRLRQVADEWVRADHAVQDRVLEQLIAYRDALDPGHRERLVDYAARKHDGLPAASVYRLFYGPLR